MSDILENLGKPLESELEELLRSCPRCGKTSANKSNPAGRCRACLNKLATAKKTPGHWQRAQTKSDDSLRRQNGKNGTATHKSKGRGTRKEIVDKIQNAEKKTGQKLSPDRINNDRGYESKNVRAVPEKLNRGRHKVDPKKLAAWRKKLKKHNIELDELMQILLMKSATYNQADIESALILLDPEETLNKGSLQRKLGKPKETNFMSDASETYKPISDPATIKRGQLELANKFIAEGNKNAYKNVDGKPHILLHRGISGTNGASGKSPMKTHEDGSLEHKSHGMYTDDHKYASQFAKNGKVHSVWVPIDRVNSNAHYRQSSAEKRLEATGQKQPEGDAGEWTIRGNHILVNPGKYQHASNKEMDAFRAHKPNNSPSTNDLGSDPRHKDRKWDFASDTRLRRSILDAWKERLEKHNLEVDDFMTLLRAKAYEKGMTELGDTLVILDGELILGSLNPGNEEV